MFRKIAVISLFALAIAGCGAAPTGSVVAGGGGGGTNSGAGSGNNNGSNSPSPNPNPAPSQPALDYATVNTNVIEPKCVRCHGGANGTYGGVNLSTYTGVKAHLNTVRSEVVSGGMPQNDSLTQDQYNQLIAWIDAGAPQTASAADAAEFIDEGE